MSEGVRDIADRHRFAEATGHPVTQHQISDKGLRAHQELIWQHVPGTDEQPALLNLFPDVGLTFGSNLQVIFDCDGVPIQHEVAVAGIACQDIQQPVHQGDQTNSELLEGLVPLAVPVGVGNDESLIRHKVSFLSERENEITAFLADLGV